jgi:signal transduction histidine kinase
MGSKSQAMALKVLHIESNPEHAELIRLAISELPDVEIELTDCVAGFEHMFNASIHKAVLSAYTLKDGFGTDLLRVIRESGHPTPFIIVSDVIDEKMAVELLSLGATDYVYKEQPQKLPIVLTRALRESHLREQIRLLGLSMHDMMSPITAVSGYSDLLLEHLSHFGSNGHVPTRENPVEKVSRYTDIIRNGVQDISGILDQLRTISRQRLDLQTDFLSVDTNLVWITREVCELMRGAAFKREHRLEFQEPDEPVFASIDLGYFKRILYNFISNAIRYSPAQSTIKIQVYKLGHEAVLAVTDEGIGVSPEHHSKIFQLYSTINSQDLEQRKSTGLGLYINSILAQKLGGRITLDSEIGVGSTFYLILPATGLDNA